MPTTKGIALRAGWQREATVTATTWPAASAAALTALLPLLDIQGNDGVQKASYVGPRSGGLGAEGFDVLNQTPVAPTQYKMRYQGLETLCACALGFGAKRLSGTVMPEQLATGVYRHLYEIDARLGTTEAWSFDDGWAFDDGLLFDQRKVRRGTLAADYQVSVWEWLSSMITAFMFQADENSVTLSLELVTHSLSRSSSVNTTVTMAKLPPSVAPAVLLSDLTFRVAPYSASVALGNGDIVRPTSWTLRYENNLATSYGPRTGLAPEEYEREKEPRATITFVDPRHTADTWQTRWGANTTLMADAKFTSERNIPGTATAYKLNWYVPSAQVTNAQLETAGVRVPPDTIQLVGVIPAGAAAGFPTTLHNGPLFIECVNGQSQHALV